ncbi:LuxR C-terminal-related transcriptional regulator [Epilithonimonas xixisoli]|uniref:Regulatory LuxR family protein n=1 Tax=Epilithonimonas xixisoli TaxID=1476462 RepID=A0A4R8IJC3_9FLAO|nr:LuxR C-terminal-related transcriptional regulator [Epilithonimonas xixisoli]TDX86719.1 regulatory LuxR family protein [Epilithonimonas xixisoli]
MIKKTSLLLILFFNLHFAQQRDSKKEIDSLINLADQNINVDFDKTLLFAEKALVKAKKEKDEERMAKAYYYAAKSLVFFRRFEESSRYLKEGLKISELKNDIILKSLFFSLQGSYYARMSLFEQSVQSKKRALELVEHNSDLQSQLLTANYYVGIADYYIDTNDLQSAHLYADKSIVAIEKIPEQKYFSTKKIYRDKPFIYFYKSWILLQEKKPQEALPFIEKAFNSAVLERYHYMALFYEIYGDYYYQTRSYQKAIAFYLKSVENKKKFKHYHANVDSKIASSYKALGDHANMLRYMERAEKRREIDGREDLKIVQKELHNALTQEEIDKINLRYNQNLIVASIIFFCISLLVAVFFNIRKKKRKIILEQESRLSEKIFTIQEKEDEIEMLRQRVNESTSELIELVKNNSPLFWTKFQDAYPDFAQKLLKLNPALKTTELCFFAYIYMGFSNKEIAEYTFKALKTIENNRSNLRKRISLNSDEDFTVWIRNYIAEA